MAVDVPHKTRDLFQECREMLIFPVCNCARILTTSGLVCGCKIVLVDSAQRALIKANWPQVVSESRLDKPAKFDDRGRLIY